MILEISAFVRKEIRNTGGEDLRFAGGTRSTDQKFPTIEVYPDQSINETPRMMITNDNPLRGGDSARAPSLDHENDDDLESANRRAENRNVIFPFRPNRELLQIPVH